MYAAADDALNLDDVLENINFLNLLQKAEKETRFLGEFAREIEIIPGCEEEVHSIIDSYLNLARRTNLINQANKQLVNGNYSRFIQIYHDELNEIIPYNTLMDAAAYARDSSKIDYVAVFYLMAGHKKEAKDIALKVYNSKRTRDSGSYENACYNARSVLEQLGENVLADVMDRIHA